MYLRNSSWVVPGVCTVAIVVSAGGRLTMGQAYPTDQPCFRYSGAGSRLSPAAQP